VEGVLLSANARNAADARRVARALAGAEGARVRAIQGRQTVAARAPWDDPAIAGDPMLAGFRAQLPATTPLSSRPEMQAAWEPGDLALKRALRGGASGEEAGRAAMRRFRSITRPEPPPASPGPYLGLVGLAALGGLALGLRWLLAVRRRREGASARQGWVWIGPAMLATAVLILVPFVVGLALSLFSHKQGTWTFVGLANFVDILGSRHYAILEPLSFYYALVVTVAWTVVNLALHVSIGLALAILLDRKGLRLRALYRVLLVIPWAVPNYITALIWKTLFHKQYGALNALLEALGLERVSWFSSAGTAFFANLCANVWLGFPFMMVVALGALQAIPRDVYEAADVDGASAFDQLRLITLPLLAPAMVPAILLGLVWTFNQFNVIYLVSGGEPDSATDILISEAFRWAFARQEQYGYAAAYAALIFVLLLGWSMVSTRISRRAEGSR
jgi:arabinogalactan oligomer/maltooligosaccharide transport system permease protein